MLRDLSEEPDAPAIEETGLTFAQNAILKALAISRLHRNELVIADDSGLEVDALNGAPGILSARYAGPNSTDEENVAKLLQILGGELTRSARFCCAMAVAKSGELITTTEGRLEGTIAFSARGENGFGYDPVFIPTNADRSLAELSTNFKNQISHRACAARQLREFLQANAGQV